MTTRSRRGLEGWVRAASLSIVAAAACAPPPDSGGGAADTAQVAVSSRDELLLASAKVALPPPGVSPTDLPNPGHPVAEDVVRFCSSCHELPSPQIHSATDWPGVVRRMWLRMDHLPPNLGVPVPDPGQRLLILQYLTEHALRVSGAALPPGTGRDLFSATCSRCHDLPDPRQHSAADWVSVVQRMSRRMDQMLGKPLDPADITRIVVYLEGVSRKQ